MEHYIGPSLAYTPTNKGVTMYYPLRRTGFFQVCGKQFNVKTPFFFTRGLIEIMLNMMNE